MENTRKLHKISVHSIGTWEKEILIIEADTMGEAMNKAKKKFSNLYRNFFPLSKI